MNFRKILSTGSLLFAGMAGLQAQQRTCDMAVSLVSPAEGAVINAFATFNITVNIVNNGPAGLVVGDTVYYNTPSMFALATAPYVLQQAIPSGGNATVTLTTGVNINGNTEDQTSSYCVKVLSNPENTGGFIDTINITNNTNCHNVTFKASGPTGVEELSKAKRNLKLYPNPADKGITLALGQNSGNKGVVITRDIAGRELSRKAFDQHTAANGDLQMDISSLVPGLYFVEVGTEQGRFSGRFVKQ